MATQLKFSANINTFNACADRYVLTGYGQRYSTDELIRRAIAEKHRMTVPVPGGTREVDVPRIMRGQASLGDEQAAERARLAISLEATMGYAVDVECAYASGQLYLLQCRPITTLSS